MHAINGKYRNGHIALSEEADWPEETEVVVTPHTPTIGIREEGWPTTPEAIAEWIRLCDSLEPFLTPEEEAEWLAALKAQKEYDLAHYEERTRRIEKMFE